MNTTDGNKRFNTMPSCIAEISWVARRMKKVLANHDIEGRKITLNFALTDAEIDAKKLRKWFDPKYYICKITPMHITTACKNNNLLTEDGYDQYYPYKQVEQELKDAGFDVIVFIPSRIEDETKITCGNAILTEGKK